MAVLGLVFFIFVGVTGMGGRSVYSLVFWAVVGAAFAFAGWTRQESGFSFLDTPRVRGVFQAAAVICLATAAGIFLYLIIPA